MTPTRLTISESLMLDLIRVTAASVVAFGHLTQPYFSTGWPNLVFLARGAVVVFFVLSGFVIRYVTCRRRTTLQHYLGDRASRIYSVAIPALLLTLLTDTIVRHINPSFYAPWAANYSPPLSRILLNLLFVSRMWHLNIEAMSNTPFWSVCYEVVYYVLYGCAFYLTGWKRCLWIAVVCLITGPRILCLFPVWLLGCVAHDLYQRWNAAGTIRTNLTRAYLAVPVVCALAIEAVHLWPELLHAGHHSSVVYFMTQQPLNVPDDAFSILWALIFMSLLFLIRDLELRPDTRFVKTLHFIAEGTFPIYLLHFPSFILAAALFRYNPANSIPKLLLFLSVLIIGVLAGHPCNLLKNWLRKLGPTLHPYFI